METLKATQQKQRNETRVTVREQVRFRPVTEPVSSEKLAETVNMSMGGLCLATDFPLQVGTLVELFVRIPREVSGERPTDVRCVARVVHIDSGNGAGKAGVGMRIERCEMIKTHDRWVS
jgi:hypothetical protein